MARPFISWTSHQVERVAWLREILDALGFEKPIVLDLGESRPAVDVVNENLRNADCMFALVAPESGSGSRMTQFVQHELTAAMLTELPIAALVDPRVDVPEQMRQSFTWIQVDMTDDKAWMGAVPKLIATALKIKGFLDHDVMSDAPSILEEVHIVNNLSPGQWLQTRSILLTARQGFSSQVDHSMDHPMGRRIPGVSVKLANPATDLTVAVGPRERFKPKLELKRNDDEEVRYVLSFDPKLRRGDSVRYRHRSVHPNIFPMTQRELRELAAKPESPPFMKDGLVGDTWDVRRSIGKLILETEVGIDLGFSEPELRVYVQDEVDEFEEERSRIGSPKVAPRLWDVREDHSRGLWICRVTIPSPQMGRTYALLVRPPEE
jgi:hypothetical protein